VARGFEADAEKQMNGPLGRLGQRLGGLGSKLAVGLSAGLAGATAGVTAFVFDAGMKLDDALDNIRTKSGLTGDGLAALEGSFRNVAKRVPGDLGLVSDAVVGLYQRTGQTGPALEDLATQVATLARITKKDLNTTIDESTRFFGDWGVAVEDQGASLDFLFKLSQQTGVGVDFLQQKLVQFGGPLRQLGFSMEESAGLIAKFQKEGVNTELVLGSMRQALGRMAKAGEAPAETLRRVMEQIKGAGSAGEANAKALELFGARAGPDMAAAIREGRFEIDGLLSSVAASGDTIASAAKDTDGWSETFSRLKNRITIGVEPLATKLVSGLDSAVLAAEPLLEAIGARLPGAFASVQRRVAPFVSTLAGIGRQAVMFFNTLRTGFTEDEGTPIERLALMLRKDLFPILKTVGDFIGRNLKPILIGLGVTIALLTAPVTTVVAAIVGAYVKFEAFRDVVEMVATFLTTVVAPQVAAFASFVAEEFSHLVGWVEAHWSQIEEAIGHVLVAVQAAIDAFVSYVSFLWSTWGDDILKVAGAVWSQVQNIIKTAVDLVRGVIELGLALINGDWGRAWDAVKGILATARDFIVGTVRNLIDLVSGIFGGGMDSVETLISGSLDAIVGFFAGIGGRIARAAGDVFGFLWSSFKSAINKVISGWNNLEFKIPGFDPPGPGPSFGGFTLGLPTVPELRDTGGSTFPGRSYLVGPGLVELFSPGRGHVMPQEQLVDALSGARSGRGEVVFEEGAVVVDAAGFSADEAVEVINAKLGWKMTTRRDR
jgi:TP901 family phage tail tape measure protein